MNIILTCGYNQSMHSIALIDLLHKQGHNIKGCLIVNTLQVKRFRNYIKMYGLKTVIDKFKNAVLKIDNNLFKETQFIERYLSTKKIKQRSVKEICNKYKIPFLVVNNLNSDKSSNFIINKSIDLIIYSGGGILKKDIINIPKYGVLNAHSGYLPFFRGMNVVEWSLLYNVIPTITVHMINPKIDEGDILYKKKIFCDKSFSIQDFRGQSVVDEVESILEVMSKFEEYYSNKIDQKVSEGKQFFVMHKTLKKIIEKKYNIKKLINGNNNKKFRFN